MKKSLVALALTSMFSMAFATDGNGGDGRGNGGGGGGGGAGVGVGIAAAAALAFGGTATAVGGAGGLGGTGGTALGGNSTGGSINAPISVGGNTIEAAASSAYAPPAHGPRRSCRLFVGFGGSGTEASLSGGIPIGNDQTCVSGAQFEFMNDVNKLAPGTFTRDDYLKAACKVEGMAETRACETLRKQQTAAVTPDSAQTALLLP